MGRHQPGQPVPKSHLGTVTFAVTLWPTMQLSLNSSRHHSPAGLIKAQISRLHPELQIP